MRLFIGGLSYNTTNEGLRAFFEEDGFTVNDTLVMIDRETGKSKGFGFVEIETEQEIEEVIALYSDARIDGRAVTVNKAHPKPTRANGGGGHRHDSRSDSRSDSRDERREYAARNR